jgi:hypothetical protein
MGATTCTPGHPCTVSYVFFDRVLHFADDAHSSADLALGYVMVHEIGHLLGLGHRPGGIMTAGFSSHDMRRAEEGWLTFTSDDAKELRAAIIRSMAACNHNLSRVAAE